VQNRRAAGSTRTRLRKQQASGISRAADEMGGVGLEPAATCVGRRGSE
jgi:hypothetical protein